MYKVTDVFAIGAPANICRNVDMMSSRLNWTNAAIFVRTKAERISDRNTSESVEARLGRLFVAPGAWSVELNSLLSARAAAENRHARCNSCLEQGFK
jgi:hypothetical protein